MPLLFVLALVGASGTRAADSTTFTVDTTDGTTDGVCGGASDCSLGDAIQAANANPGPDTIAFAIPTAPLLIAPATELPAITDPVTIDGTTQPGFVNKPIVELHGAALPLGSRGIRLRARESVVRGLVVNGFNRQITIELAPVSGASVDSNRIVGNYVGTDITGGFAAGDQIGIEIFAGSDHVIGGSVEGDRNVISGNGVGVNVESGAGRVTIQGNYIGTNANGDAAVQGILPSPGFGIQSNFSPGPIVIGGDNAGQGNVISGNRETGLVLHGGSRHEVVRNMIGTDPAGEEPVPNTNGVALLDEASNTPSKSLIAGNVISGNNKTGSTGLVLSNVTDIVVQGNKIGVDIGGLDKLPNFEGVKLTDSTSVQIGGTTEAARNIISGNIGHGISFNRFPTRNTIQGNFIGIGADGRPLGNGFVGIRCCGLPGAPGGNVIGGLSAGTGNVIAHNGEQGIVVGSNFTETGPLASILGNSIHSNGGLGIDLTSRNAGPTPNDLSPPCSFPPGPDCDAGPNDLQNFPVIDSIISAGGVTIANVSLDSTPGTNFHLEFFRNDACDDSHYGEGQALVGTREVRTGSDGHWSDSVTLSSDPSAMGVITATATLFSEAGVSLAGSTSEFSRCVDVPPPSTGTIIVDKTTNPAGDQQSFSFDASGGSYADFSLTDAATPNTQELPAGSYAVSETVPSGWDLTSASCASSIGDTETPGTIELDAGETVTCTFTNTKRGSVTLKKTTNGVVDPSKDINFVLTGPGLPTIGIARSTFGDQDGVLEWPNLVPGQYKICETPVPAGFTSFWKLDGVVVTPYNPDASKSPPEDLGTRCYDFSVAPGQMRAFEVDNSHPGGDARTIGYWKNWNRCTSGNQSATAAKNGGAAEGFFLVEDLLPQAIGNFPITTCQQAAKVLSKQDQAGKNKSSDAAYELASQLLAARFNLAAGAETCTAVQQAVLDGQTLLDQINFTGSGDYFGSKSKDARRAQALSFAATLDGYNNGNLC